MKREINVMDYEKDFLEETAPTYVNKEVWKPKTAKEADWCLGKIREKEAEIEDVLRFVEAKKKSLDEYLEKRTRPLMDAQEHLSALHWRLQQLCPKICAGRVVPPGRYSGCRC